MLTIDTCLTLVREKPQAMRQEAERERLIQAAGFQQPANDRPLGKVTHTVGARLRQWGLKL